MTVVLLAHHAATQTAGPTKSDWIRWTGVLITAVGTLVAAPSGAARLLRAVAGTVAGIWFLLTLIFSRKASAGVGRLLGMGARGFRWLIAEAIKRQGDNPMPPVDTPGKTQIRWAESESLEAKLERLRSELEQAFEQISDVRGEAKSADAELNKALVQVSDDLRKVNADLSSRMDAADKQAAAIDSRGILLLGAGVLTGIPDELARIAWIGWVAVGVSVFVMLSVLLALGLARRGKRSTADIQVAESDGVLHLRVRDNGRGGAGFSHGSGRRFDQPQAPQRLSH